MEAGVLDRALASERTPRQQPGIDRHVVSLADRRTSLVLKE
jgi:hypothetical protein